MAEYTGLFARETNMKALFAVLLVSLLAGCAAKVVSSSPRSVVISGSDVFLKDAQGLADAECAKHKRFARLEKMPSPTSDHFMFDCVL
jgi:uncharacterized lipoprotein YajG